MLSGLTERIGEELKAVSYDSERYKHRLGQMNKVFGCVGLGLKEREILVATGQRTLSDYVFVTSRFIST